MNQLIFQLGQRAIMHHHVVSCLPEEACGLILGANGVVQEIIPVTNRAHSRTRYEMEPIEQLGAFRKMAVQQLSLLAIYHSHPDGPAQPSRTDIESYAYPDTTCIIWAFCQDKWQINGYKIEKGLFTSELLVFPDTSNP